MEMVINKIAMGIKVLKQFIETGHSFDISLLKYKYSPE